ncbi:Hypothetical predicted protein [Olea europaea subsp. europaea]|uniref:Uncharacterized protein n=1 Tax=Olea europaea subsp. europaea TaxID=158383 RepID=A0A8S0RL00_OLEEU|nr:Hypothetical predicted protein [Olea europaea subsp. europaea]
MPPQPPVFYPVSEPGSEAELTITKMPLVQAKKQGAEVFPPRPLDLEKKWYRGVSTSVVRSGKKNVWDLGAEVMPPQPPVFYPISEPGSEAELTITKMPLIQAKKQGAEAKKQGAEVFPPRPSDLEKKCMGTLAPVFYPVSEPGSEAELTITKMPLVQAKKQGAEVFPPRPSDLEKKCMGSGG